MTTSKKHKKHTGGRAIQPSVEPGVVVINYPGGDSNFTREIWEARGRPSNLALGDGWTSIHDFTFVDSDLQKIKIPTSITYIGHSAFENAEQLESVTFNPGSQLKTIGEGAFKNAKSLKTIEIPSGVETISFSTFQGARRLTSIKIDVEHSQLKTIEAGAFNNTDLHSLDLPKSIKRISMYVFYGNANLTTIRMYPIVLESLNADDLNLQAHFGMNNFNEDNMFFGIDHPVNIISISADQSGGRKSRSRTRRRPGKKTTARRRRRYKNKSRRRRTKQHK